MKKFIKNALATVIIAGAFLYTGIIVHADNAPSVNRKYTTDIYFKLKSQDTTNNIIPVLPNIDNNNPDYTKQDTNDTYNAGTGETGPLTLDAVPHNLTFENPTINSGRNNYDIKLSKNDANKYPMTQVSDRRDGGNHNWNLSASLSIPQQDKGAITSETITMPTLNNTSRAVGAYNTDSSNAPEVNNNLVIPSSDNDTTSVNVMSANQDNGAGTWANFFDSNRINLNLKVLPNQIKSNQDQNQNDQHTSTITWNLTDTPNSSQSSNNP